MPVIRIFVPEIESERSDEIDDTRGHDGRAFQLPTACRTSTRAMKMDDSIPSDVPDDDRALGPLLGTLPPEILDVVVKKLGWFRTTFAMAGRTCSEAVERVPSTRAVLTEKEREQMEIWSETPPLAVVVVEGDVEAMEWLIQRYDSEIEDLE